MIARKFTRRDFIRMGLTTTAGAFLVGCGSTGIPSPAASTSEAKKEEPAAPAVQNMLINVWAPSCDAKCEQVYLPDWLSKYTEKHSEITFKAAGPGWDDYWTKLPLNIASGAGPDLYYFHPNWTQQFVDGGLIEAWSEADVAELKNLCSNVELRMIDGKLYFFDEGIMTGLIFYNKKMWKEAGLTDADIPKSWPQLIEIAKELTVTNSAGEIERAGFNWGHTDARWTWVMLKYQMGEFLFTADGRKGLINTEGAKAAAQMILDWEFKDKVGSSDLPSSDEAFVNEKAAMSYCWGWLSSWILSDYPNLEFGVFPVPSLDGKPAPAYDRHGGECTFAVNPKIEAAKKKVCFDYIKWYATNPDFMRQRAKAGVAPALKSIQNDPELMKEEVVKASLEQFDRTIWVGTPPPDWENALNTFADPVFVARTGEVEQALADCQKAVDEVLAKPEKIYWGYQERIYTHASEMHEPKLLG